jgi:hypothetical protein
MRPVAQIAQSVEQGIENPRVGGSIPSLGTKNTEKPLHRKIQGFFFAFKKMPYFGPSLATKIHPTQRLRNWTIRHATRDGQAFMRPHTSLFTIFT